MAEQIDINRASVDDFERVLVGVGRRRARAIVRRRKELGGFESVEELTRVRGIAGWVLDMNRELLTCGGGGSSGTSGSAGSGGAAGAGGSGGGGVVGGGASFNGRGRRCVSRRRRENADNHLAVEEEDDEDDDDDEDGDDDEEDNDDEQEALALQGREEEEEEEEEEELQQPGSSRNNAGTAEENNNYRGIHNGHGIRGVNEREEGIVSIDDEDGSLDVNEDDDDRGDRRRMDDDEDEEDSDEEMQEEEEEEGAEERMDDGANGNAPQGERGAGVGGASGGAGRNETLQQALANARLRQMKRKSEHGPDMRALSPGKKPCKGSEHPSHALGSLLPCTSVPTTFGELRAASGQGQGSSRRRLAGVTPPAELQDWLRTFQSWSGPERLLALDELIDRCEPPQIKHVMQVIEPQFQRDFISLLPKELALYVLSFLEPRDLLRAAQTCRYWRILAEDNLLWREKCREEGLDEPLYVKRKKSATPNFTYSPWKSAYMRQHRIDMNWRCGEIRAPKVLKGHDDHVITCLQFCGNRIVSGSDDNTLKVWSAVTGKCLRTLVGHTGGVWSSQMRGNIIVSGSTDRTLKVWNADTGQCVHTLYGHTSTVRCMHLHGNRVVSGSRDATLRVWDIETGQCLHVLAGHVAAVRCVQYDGRRVVSGAYDYTVKVWDPESETCLHTLQGHTNRVYSLQFDGVHIVSGSLDTSIRVWDAETGTCLHTLVGHQSLTSGMELRDNILVSGNADSTVKIWDIKTGQCLQTLQGPNKHQSAVTCLQFSRKLVVTSSDDGTVKLWDLRTGDFLRNLVSLDSGGSGGVVWRVRCSNTKLVCAVGSRNGTEETKLLVLDFDVDSK